MAFTDAEKVAVRRFCGYGVYGMGTPLPASGYRFSTHYGVLEYKLQTLGPDEEDVVRTVYLANLAPLEVAVVGTSDNLDTAQAAVWTHNPHELRDREALLDNWRRRLCAFLGLPPGPHLGAGGLSFTV